MSERGSLLREIKTLGEVLSTGDAPERQQWQNAINAYQDELDSLINQLSLQQREAAQYIKQREVAFTLRELVAELRAEFEPGGGAASHLMDRTTAG